jgi:hypothetical protein
MVGAGGQPSTGLRPKTNDRAFEAGKSAELWPFQFLPTRIAEGKFPHHISLVLRKLQCESSAYCTESSAYCFLASVDIGTQEKPRPSGPPPQDFGSDHYWRPFKFLLERAPFTDPCLIANFENNGPHPHIPFPEWNSLDAKNNRQHGRISLREIHTAEDQNCRLRDMIRSC